MQTLSVGDIVKVSENIHSVKELQKGHGEWNDSMKAVSYMAEWLQGMTFSYLVSDGR